MCGNTRSLHIMTTCGRGSSMPSMAEIALAVNAGHSGEDWLLDQAEYAPTLTIGNVVGRPVVKHPLWNKCNRNLALKYAKYIEWGRISILSLFDQSLGRVDIPQLVGLPPRWTTCPDGHLQYLIEINERNPKNALLWEINSFRTLKLQWDVRLLDACEADRNLANGLLPPAPHSIEPGSVWLAAWRQPPARKWYCSTPPRGLLMSKCI